MGSTHYLISAIATVLLWDTPPPTGGSDDVDFYLHGVLAERQKLRSGIYSVRGSRSVRDTSADGSTLSADIAIFCAFDESRLRLDNVEEVFQAVAPVKDLSQVAVHTKRRKYYRTTEESAVWLEEKDTLWIQTPDSAMVGQFLCFDPRALGATTWKYVTDSRGSQLEKTISAYAQGSRQKSVELLDDGIACLTFVATFGDKREELRLWIDPEHGFTVTRMETGTRTGDGDAATWQVKETANVSWLSVGEVWVPSTCAMQRFAQAGEQALDLTFEWQAVNDAVESAYFTRAGLGVAPTTQVIDTTHGDSFVIRDLREQRVEIVDISTLRVTLIAVTAFVVCGLLFLFVQRRRARWPFDARA